MYVKIFYIKKKKGRGMCLYEDILGVLDKQIDGWMVEYMDWWIDRLLDK